MKPVLLVAQILFIGAIAVFMVRKRQAIDDAQESLESRILERTRELLTANRELEAHILERGKAEEALRLSEEKYRLIVENAKEGIMVARKGLITFVNAPVLALTGYSMDDLLSMPFANAIHPDDRAMALERYRKRLKGEEAPTRYDIRIITKSGETR